MLIPETVYLTRQGQLHFDAASASKHEYVELNNPNQEPVSVRSIGTLVYVVRFGDERKVTLVVFRLNANFKARAVVIHDVKDDQDNSELAISVFSRILSFDNNRMGNRDRNTLLPIIRQSCPQTFHGKFCSPTKTLRFVVNENILKVYQASSNEVVLRTNYVKMSRSIKDKL